MWFIVIMKEKELLTRFLIFPMYFVFSLKEESLLRWRHGDTFKSDCLYSKT